MKSLRNEPHDKQARCSGNNFLRTHAWKCSMVNYLYSGLLFLIGGLVTGFFGVTKGLPFLAISLTSLFVLTLLLGMKHNLLGSWSA